MNAHELKGLQTRHAKARAEADSARLDFRQASTRLDAAENQLREIGRQIAEGQRNFQISEHAMLRYVERIGGFNVAQATAALEKELKPIVEQLGDGRFPIKDTGCVAIVRNKTVITIEPAH